MPTGVYLRAHPWRRVTLVCPKCGRAFEARINEGYTRTFCSRSCASQTHQAKRHVFPGTDDEIAALLQRLYWVERRTTPEIAALYQTDHVVVKRWMRRLGITRRPMGPRKAPHCIEEGCRLPVHRIQHKTNGCWYGRRCRMHWIVFRMIVTQRYNDKHLGKDDEAWLRRMRQLLARVKRLNREVSQSLNPASGPATTSPDA